MLSCNAGLHSCSWVSFLSSLLLDLVSAGVGVTSLCQMTDCFLDLGPSGNCVVPDESENLEWPMMASFVSAAPFALFLLYAPRELTSVPFMALPLCCCSSQFLECVVPWCPYLKIVTCEHQVLQWDSFLCPKAPSVLPCASFQLHPVL